MTESKSNKTETAQSVEEQALIWFTRLTEESVKPSERLAFNRWYTDKPEHKQAYDDIATLWNSEEFTDALKTDEKRIGKHSRQPRTFFSALALAATILLSVWAGWQNQWFLHWQADDYTDVGQKKTLVLADGSMVTLDSDSAIIISYTDDTRGVKLLAGRAFFDVQSDSSRPFIVSSNAEQIRVVGTRFTIDHDSETPLSVQRGTVAYQANLNESEMLVNAGEQLNKGHDFTITPIDKPSITFAWLDNRLKFSDQTLNSVMAELDRYQPGTIIIANPKLATIQVTGQYTLDDPSKIITSLAEITGAKVARVSEYLTVIY